MTTYTAHPCTVPQPVSAVGLASFIVLRQLGFQDVQYDEPSGSIRGHSPRAVVALRVWPLDERSTGVQVSSAVTERAHMDLGGNRRLAEQLGEEIAEAASQFAAGRLDPVTALEQVRVLDATPPE